MSSVSKKYIDEAAKTISAEGAGFAIWLIENAIGAAAGDERELVIVETFSKQNISREYLDKACRIGESRLEYALNMLGHPAGMCGEEWMLIITHISNAEALTRYSKRVGSPFEFPSLDATLKALAAATENYANSDFRSELREALERHPHLPLPTILLGE